VANYLEVAVIESMVLLSARGRSQRRIARELEVSREAVSRYLALREAAADLGPDPL
jgi:predicted transcriptional regulator